MLIVGENCVFSDNNDAVARYVLVCGSQVDDNKKLGEWAGLCKIDKEGKARKVVGCSCVVIKVRDPCVKYLQ